MPFNGLPTSFDFANLLSAATHYSESQTEEQFGSPNLLPPLSEASSSTGSPRSSNSTSSSGTYRTAPGSAPVETNLPSSFPVATGPRVLNVSHLFQEFTNFLGAYLVQHASVNNPNNFILQFPDTSPSHSPPAQHASTSTIRSFTQSPFNFSSFGLLQPPGYVSAAGSVPRTSKTVDFFPNSSQPAPLVVDPLSMALEQFAPPSFPSSPPQTTDFFAPSPTWMDDPFSIDPHPLTPPSVPSQFSQHPVNILDPSAEVLPPRSHEVPLFLPTTDSPLHSRAAPVLPHNAAVSPNEVVEDDGNEADTESFPMFSARTRAKKRQYTGEALISPDEARKERETGSRRHRAGVREIARSSGLPNRRPAYRIRVANQVRQELASLLGMDHGRSLVDVCQALSNNELNAFTALWNTSDFHHLHADCCDINNFYIDLINTPHSPWNQSASRVFTIHFIKKFKLSTSNDMMNIVQETFYGRLKSLHASLRKERAGNDVIALSNQATRRWLRKQTIFSNRLMATSHPKLQRYNPIIRRLGVAGMSTDESDQETSNASQLSSRTFRVRVPIWRSSLLTLLLRWIDKMYLLLRRMSKTLRGALPRIRIAPDADTEATIRAQAYATMGSFPLLCVRFVNNLPKCAYDSTWFGIFLGDGFDLRYTNEEWDFTVDLQLLAFFEKYLSLNVNASDNI